MREKVRWKRKRNIPLGIGRYSAQWSCKGKYVAALPTKELTWFEGSGNDQIHKCDQYNSPKKILFKPNITCNTLLKLPPIETFIHLTSFILLFKNYLLDLAAKLALTIYSHFSFSPDNVCIVFSKLDSDKIFHPLWRHSCISKLLSMVAFSFI